MDQTKMEDLSQMNEITAGKSELLDVVFSWSLDDILNDNLYKEKMEKIPESFTTVDEYFSSYLYPLFEETRTELHSSLKNMSGAPYAEVVFYDKVKFDRKSSHHQSQLFDFKVNGWRNINPRGKEAYRTLPGDIFALINCRPETVRDLNELAQAWVWVLAHVKRISGDKEAGETSSTSFRVELSKDIDIIVDDQCSSIYVVNLANITTNKRICNALRMRVNLKIVKGVLHNNDKDEDEHDPCSLMNDECLSEDPPTERLSKLNVSQKEAVMASLKLTKCKHRSHVKLIWGPPGTGKTKTLSTLLYFLLKKKCRLLICAPTNIAITQVASRVLELIKNSSRGSDGVLGNILLFGNKQCLRLGHDIEDIYLDHRVKRLAECFMPVTGWRGCFRFLSNFLEDCVSDYNVFVDNESKIGKESIELVDSPRQIPCFVSFLQNRFKAAAEPVRQCITIFCTHLPKSLIGKSNFENMQSLRQLLKSFETSLLRDGVDSSELLGVFSCSKVLNNASVPVLLEEKRRKCITTIKELHRSLGETELPTIRFSEFVREESIKKLCFQMATLVFCTASNSFKLYRSSVDPFDILIVDEAAQLKECESLIPMQLPGLRHAILFGDECQLPAMVTSSISSGAGFGRSVFQRLSLVGWPKHLLNVQYRMHPEISAFPNEQFYSNKILDAPSVSSRSYERCYLPGPIYGHYAFINVSEGREEFDDGKHSRRNMVEAAVVTNILKNLFKSWHCSTQKLAIGVISPYTAQVLAIEEMLGKKYENHENFAVKVRSVDGFQGGEEDIVIISTVRSNLDGSVGFTSDLQRTNVALTRAKYCLWILGHEDTLIRSGSIWKTLIGNAKQRHCFYNSDEDTSMVEAVVDIKKKLDQLDHLLNKDSILFKSARWKVLFSDNFFRTFSKLPSVRAKKSVMNLLVRLSNGWRPKIKADPACENSLHIVKQYKVEGHYVICTNDINKDGRYFQVLKIWDIVLLEDIAKLVRRLEKIYVAFTDDFLSRCKQSSHEGELEVPMTWSTSLDIARFKNSNCTESATNFDGTLDGINYAENGKVNESLLLMKFYALSAGTVGYLLSDGCGTLDLPFEVTDEEKEIIQHCRSSFILGRSGTGKTTVLSMKLFQKEQLHHRAVDTSVSFTHSHEVAKREHILRQLFVTVSPKLCYAIKYHVSALKSFARGETSSPESVPVDVDYIDDRDQFRGIPDSFVGVPQNSYPLVITFSKFLLMLDGTLGISFFDRFRGEMKLMNGRNSSTGSTILLMKLKEVNYDKFSTCYWPHMDSRLTKKLDASRVFTEIISSIKGGIQVGKTDGSKLSMESYLQLSESRTSTLSLQQREMIYNIFLTYEKMKVDREEFDLADLVNDLHKRFKCERYHGDNIDFVYIDEVQDLAIRQIALFKYICKNVDEGFVFSGDTAQTIARGIDFRFQDVRCLFYTEFVMKKRNEGDYENQEKGQISAIFHLCQNFRTHAGILKLGHSVIQLIYHFFPQSIDILPPETSYIFGEAPILLKSGSDENAIITIFGNTENERSTLVGFGAEQVILVRDDCVREEISNYVGRHALVLTIVECKGLEFQDVLFYNFFGSSPFKNQWRVVYEYMEKNNLLDSTLPEAFPNFNPTKHNVLCSELKQLYVAITRTRQRLWICENEENISKPVFDYWKKKHAVQVRQLDDSLARAMQVASSPEEWRARGKKLLAVKNYEVATMCFERAGDIHWEKYAKAAGLQASANRAHNCEEASEILRQSGELFESINEYKRAADCYYESKNYDKAGRLYHQHCGESEVERAGECFTIVGCYELASQVYATGNFFSECLSCCTNGGLFDIGLEYIECWKQQARSSLFSPGKQRELDTIEQEFLEKCAVSYYEQDDKHGMMKFVKAFNSEDSMRKFLRNLDCLDELLTLEIDLGNFLQAADIARDKGDLLFEANLLEKGGLCKEASALFLWYALASCLWVGGGKGWPLKQFPQKIDLLMKARNSARGVKPHLYYITVCTEVLILLRRNHSLPVLKDLLIMCQSLKSMRGEILVSWIILDTLLGTHVSKYECEKSLVDDLSTYSIQMISQNKISVETLFYFWNSYVYTILAIFKFLEAFEDDEATDLAEIGEFCFNYLGVRKLASNTITAYVCVYPDANWLGDFYKRNLQKFGKLIRIDKQSLLTAARNYWSAELISTGMKVVRILEALERPTVVDFVNPFRKANIATHVYEVSRFLISWKYMEPKSHDSRTLQISIGSLVDRYFGYVFPMDWRKPMCKDMILLREKDISSKILEEFIVNDIQGKGQLTYGQLGRMAMVLFGSCNDKTELCQTVLNRIDANSSWNSLFKELSGCRSSDTSIVHAFNLHRALNEVYNANWKHAHYISPFCLFYLVDRLMISLLDFQGSLVTCRSSLVEWFTHNGWNVTFGNKVVPSNDETAFVRDTYDFLHRMVHQLIVNKSETSEWINIARINANKYFHILLLKLVVLLCLLDVNYGGRWQSSLNVLNMLGNTQQLPPEFFIALRRKNRWVVNCATVAEALKAIGDPMVIVSSWKDPSNLSCKDSIYLRLADQSKEDLLGTLFLDIDKISPSYSIDKDSQHRKQNEGCSELKHGNIWEFFDSLKLVENEDNKSKQRFVSCAPMIKTQVDRAYKLITSAIAQASVENGSTDYAAEADCFLLELRLLSAALDASGDQLKDSMLLIKDIFKKLKSDKAVFENFLNPLLSEKDTKDERSVVDLQKENSADIDPGNQSTSRGHETNMEDEDDTQNGDERNFEEGQKDDSSTAAATVTASASGNKNEGPRSKGKNKGRGSKKSKKKGKKNK